MLLIIVFSSLHYKQKNINILTASFFKTPHCASYAAHLFALHDYTGFYPYSHLSLPFDHIFKI